MATQTMPTRDADRGVLSLAPPAFVGREREFAALTEALARPPAVVLVEGEAGIGKSRLVQEFLASPSCPRRRVLVGTCPPFAEPSTLGVVVDAVRQATETVSGLPLSKLAGVLRPLFPEWADDLPAAPEPAEDARAARHRVFAALAELLDCLDVGVLVAEDAHWADEATLEFLLLLVSRQRVSLVVTYRPEEVPAASPLLRLTSRVPSGTTWLRLSLDPLDVAGTAVLVSSMLGGGQVSAGFARFLYEQTEGLPLAVEESVRLLRDRGDVRRRDGEWVRRHVEWIAVPPTVRDAVLERVGRLGAAAQAILRAAAVLADPADEAAVLAVAGLAADRGQAGLVQAIGSQLLSENHAGIIAFRHTLACRAIYESIPIPERRALHVCAGRALEGRSPLPVARLARHFREGGDTQSWSEYGEQAADIALASGDEASAAVLLHDLLVHARPSAADVVRLAGKIPLLWFRGERSAEDLIRALRGTLDAGELTPDEEAEVRYQLGRTLFAADDWAAGRVELEAAIPHLMHNAAVAVRAMTQLGWPDGSDAPAAEHLRWLRRAARVTLPTDSIDHLVALVNRTTALLTMGREEGWAEAGRIPEESSTTPGRLQIAVGNVNVADAAMLWGRYEEASRRLSTALDLADQYQYPRLRSLALATRTHLDWLTGAWSGLFSRAESLAADDDTSSLDRMECLLVMGLLQAAQGSRGEAGDLFHEVLVQSGAQGTVIHIAEPAAALARVYLADGATHKAVRITEEPTGLVVRKGVWVWAGDLAPARVEALLAAGWGDEATSLVAEFARGLRGRDAPAPRAGLALCRALLAEGNRQHARAATLFARAADAWQALPRPYDALLARERQGRCLLVDGRKDEALSLLREVLDGLSDLGATGDADRVAHLLRQQGTTVPRVWRGGRRGYGDQLSPRELEVVRLIAAGHTTRQVAERLCRSPDTVYTQLRAAMRKLGASSRTALALRAVEAGIIAVSDQRLSSDGSVGTS